MSRLPSLNALHYFTMVVRAGGFTKAAEQLHVTQGAVSRQIKALEQSMGTSLFTRVHHGVELTETGKELAKVADEAFGVMERGLRRIRAKRQRERLHINIPPTFATRWLAPRVPDFCSQYPSVDMHITTDWVKSVSQGRQAACDCLVVFDREGWAQGPFSAPKQPLMLEHHVLVCAPKLWRDNVPEALTGRTLLHILNGEERLPVWERWLERYPVAGVDPKPGLSFSTLDQAINAAMNGAGIAIVDEAMIRPELEQGSLKRLSPETMIGPYGYWFVDLTQDAERKRMVDTFRDWLFVQTRNSLA